MNIAHEIAMDLKMLLDDKPELVITEELIRDYVIDYEDKLIELVKEELGNM